MVLRGIGGSVSESRRGPKTVSVSSALSLVSWVTDLSVSTAEGGPLTRSGAQVRTGWRCGSRGEGEVEVFV